MGKSWNTALIMAGIMLTACGTAGAVDPTITENPLPTETSVSVLNSDQPTATQATTRSDVNIQVTPTSGAIGTWVTVSGTGFPAGATVSLQIGTANNLYAYGQTSADANGLVTVQFGMPATWPSGGRITDRSVVIRLGAGENYEVETVFDLQLPPTATLTATLDVASGDSESDTTPTVTAQPTETPAVTNTPRPTATTVPQDLNPVIVLDPTSPTGGSSVTVSGSDFPPNGTVTVRIGLPDGSQGMNVAQGQANADGVFTAAFTMPTQWADGSTIPATKIEVRGTSSVAGWYAWVTFDYRGS